MAGTPGLAETLTRDWQRAVRFYVRYGVTEELVRCGVPALDADAEDLAERVRSPVGWVVELRTHAEVVLP